MREPLEDPEVLDEEAADEPAEADEEVEAEPSAQVEASYEELFSKRAEADEEEEESLLEMTRDERIESLSIRTVPRQANEFVCTSCHLVKHNSQLADAKRALCRDCV